MRITRLKHLSSTMRYTTITDLRATIPYASNSYHTRELTNVQKNKQNHSGYIGLGSAVSSQHLMAYSGPHFSNTLFRGGPVSVGVSPYGRFFSSSSQAKGDIPGGTDFIANSSATGNNLNPGGVGGDDWTEKLREVWRSTVDVAKYTGEKAKEASGEAGPHVQLWLDAHPLLRDVIVPISSTLAVTLLTWSLLPSLLRRFHKYSMESPASLWVPVPYERSIWGAMESPIKSFITFVAFLQVGAMVAPTVLPVYMGQATRGAVIVSLVWFLHRWKTNTITQRLADKRFDGVERDELLLINNVSSVGLFVLGSMAIAEACGVAVQSILTVGGIGGVATAFAAKDVLGNLLSGLVVQSSRPFSVGDTIKAGSVEGQVIEVGLTATSLLTTEKFPATVPNSLFFSQVIVNKSRALYHSVVKRIPLCTEDVGKITQISEDIKTMLKSNPHVFMEKDAPYCFVSQIERANAVLTFGCNLKDMKNKAGEHDILLKALLIIKEHGVELSSTMQGGILH